MSAFRKTLGWRILNPQTSMHAAAFPRNWISVLVQSNFLCKVGQMFKFERPPKEPETWCSSFSRNWCSAFAESTRRNLLPWTLRFLCFWHLNIDSQHPQNHTFSTNKKQSISRRFILTLGSKYHFYASNAAPWAPRSSQTIHVVWFGWFFVFLSFPGIWSGLSSLL